MNIRSLKMPKQKRPPLSELKNKLLKDKKNKMLYESLEAEFRLLEQMIEARNEAGLTQEEVADRMGTKKSNVSRLENSLLQDPSPTLATLKKYAAAVNCHIEINLVSNRGS